MSLATDLVRRGHFVYESGHHGDTWLDLDLLVEEPARVRAIAGMLAGQVARYHPTLAVGPLTGGAFLAQWVADTLDIRFAYANPDGTIPPGFTIAGHVAVVVDDAINAGHATTATVRTLRAAGAMVVALASPLVCTPAGLQVGPNLEVPQHFLEEVPTRLWSEVDCPACA